MPQPSWVPEIYFRTEEYGDARDTGTPLRNQSLRVQSMWRTPWKATGTDTAEMLKKVTLYSFHKPFHTKALKSCLSLKKLEKAWKFP